jgi:diadenylate cyclase
MEFLIPRFKDIVDIFLIAFLIYQLLTIVRRSGGYQILLGIMFIFLIYLIAALFDLKMVSSALASIRNYWIIALIVLFQPELRSLLARFNISRELGGVLNMEPFLA